MVYTALVLAICIGVEFYIHFKKAQPATTRTTTTPLIVSLDEAIGRGMGVIHFNKGGIPQVIHIAINDVNPTTVGMATLEARDFLGDNFQIYFSREEETEDGRSYVMLMYNKDF